MFAFLGFVFFLVLVVIIFGLTIINKILGVLFGLGRRKTSTRTTSSTNRASQSAQNRNGNAQDTPNHKKVFADDEGEYVDFEEIKDE